MKVKNKTVIRKIDNALMTLNDLFCYLKSKDHDQGILSIRDLTPIYGKLFEARDKYKDLLIQQKRNEISSGSIK